MEFGGAFGPRAGAAPSGELGWADKCRRSRAAPVYVAQEVCDDAFSIAGGAAGMKVSGQLTGVRNDASAQANPLVVEQEKQDDEKANS